MEQMMNISPLEVLVLEDLVRLEDLQGEGAKLAISSQLIPSRLRRMEYVFCEDYEIFLTDRGRKFAQAFVDGRRIRNRLINAYGTNGDLLVAATSAALRDAYSQHGSYIGAWECGWRSAAEKGLN